MAYTNYQSVEGMNGTVSEARKYSIREEFSGTTVLVTGGTGYIGSLVVEQLLRTTNVAKVLLLIRPKRGMPTRDRLQQLLHSGLFHMVRDDPQLLNKVGLVEGDMESEDLGLSPEHMDIVFNQVHIIIHSAASIGLEADVQRSLRSNYLGTHRLLALASRMPAQQLRCFLHVSTAYVNMNLPKGSSVDEVIYPLRVGNQAVAHEDIVEDLMSMEPEGANVRAQMYLDMWGFPNTYTLGKNLTEKLVASYHRAGLPVAIVRPSLVCGLAGDPYPGYCGNLAGPVGMGVAMAVGLFDKLQSVAMVPTHVWDAVPGDIVSSVILAAAAATAAHMDINEYQEAAPASAQEPMIVHAGTSTTYPISMVEAAHAGADFIRNNPAPFKLPGSRMFKVPLDYQPDEAAVKRCKYWTSWKVWAAVHLLEMLGQHKTAHRLKYGHLAWDVMNSTKTDVNIFFSSRNLLKLEERLDAADADTGLFKITWTLKNGGWPRYIATNLAGMYRHVFGITQVKGLKYNDFKFIPNKPYKPAAAAAAAEGEGEEVSEAATGEQDAEQQQPDQQQRQVQRKASISRTGGQAPKELPDREDSDSSGSGQRDVIAASFKGAAAAFSRVPASGSEMFSDLQLPGTAGCNSDTSSSPFVAAAAAAAGLDGPGGPAGDGSGGAVFGSSILSAGQATCRVQSRASAPAGSLEMRWSSGGRLVDGPSTVEAGKAGAADSGGVLSRVRNIIPG